MILHVVYDHQQQRLQQPIQPNQQQLEKQRQKLIQAQHQFEIHQQQMEYELQQLQRMEYEQQQLLHTCRLCLKTFTQVILQYILEKCRLSKSINPFFHENHQELTSYERTHFYLSS